MPKSGGPVRLPGVGACAVASHEPGDLKVAGVASALS